MIYIDLQEKRIRHLGFYLAMEEYVARRLPFDECFFLWQVNPTVIFGRNQVVENEVNLDYCREHGIEVYRRKSGGGCVYADMSNVMMAYICSDDNVESTFKRYMNMVAGALNDIGIPAWANDHNDVMIGQRKVSGNAIYHLPGRNIAHGTLLYDTDMTNMLQAITPSAAKLNKHGVESVRQRITLLKDHTQMPFADIRKHLRQKLCGNETYVIKPEDIKAIEEIEKEYIGAAPLASPLTLSQGEGNLAR